MLKEVVGMSKTCKLHSFFMKYNTHKGFLLFNLNHQLQKDFLVTRFLAGYEERNTICMGKNACQMSCNEDVKNIKTKSCNIDTNLKIIWKCGFEHVFLRTTFSNVIAYNHLYQILFHLYNYCHNMIYNDFKHVIYDKVYI